jgi:hypothetical protein
MLNHQVEVAKLAFLPVCLLLTFATRSPLQIKFELDVLHVSLALWTKTPYSLYSLEGSGQHFTTCGLSLPVIISITQPYSACY